MHVKFIRTAVGAIANTVSSYVDHWSHGIFFSCPCPVPTPTAILYIATRLYFKKPKSESWGRWLSHLVIQE